jgi:hypothetical protein
MKPIGFLKTTGRSIPVTGGKELKRLDKQQTRDVMNIMCLHGKNMLCKYNMSTYIYLYLYPSCVYLSIYL